MGDELRDNRGGPSRPATNAREVARVAAYSVVQLLRTVGSIRKIVVEASRGNGVVTSEINVGGTGSEVLLPSELP